MRLCIFQVLSIYKIIITLSLSVRIIILSFEFWEILPYIFSVFRYANHMQIIDVYSLLYPMVLWQLWLSNCFDVDFYANSSTCCVSGGIEFTKVSNIPVALWPVSQRRPTHCSFTSSMFTVPTKLPTTRVNTRPQTHTHSFTLLSPRPSSNKMIACICFASLVEIVS